MFFKETAMIKQIIIKQKQDSESKEELICYCDKV